MKMHKQQQQQQQQQQANSTLGTKQKRQVPRAVEESDDDDDSSSSGAESESDEDEPTPAKPTKRPTNSSVTTDKSSPGLGSKFLQRFGGASTTTTTTTANSLSVNTEDASDDLLNSSINSFDVDTPKGKSNETNGNFDEDNDEEEEETVEEEVNKNAKKVSGRGRRETPLSSSDEDDEEESTTNNSRAGDDSTVSREESMIGGGDDSDEEDEEDEEDESQDEDDDEDEEDKHGWERMEHTDGGKTKVYFWNWDSGKAVWKRPVDYSTDEDANEEVAEEAKRKKVAAAAANGGKGEKKRGEAAKTVLSGRNDEAEREAKAANQFRKMLSDGIEVSSCVDFYVLVGFIFSAAIGGCCAMFCVLWCFVSLKLKLKTLFFSIFSRLLFSHIHSFLTFTLSLSSNI